MRCLRHLRQFLLAALLFFLAWPALPQTQSRQIEVEWRAVERVIAFGDVHGAYPELENLLRDAGILDAAGHWSAGTAHVVSLGDLLDRGAGSRRVMDLLMGLQGEALAAGGRLHVLLGNHEAMNLMGDLRYVGRDEFRAYEDLETGGEREESRASWTNRPCTGDCPPFDTVYPPGYFGHRAAFAPGGRYGSWLLSLPVAVKINDTLYMHAGPSGVLGGMTLEQVNVRYRSALGEHLGQNDAQDPLLSDAGPNWYRGPALCNEAAESDVLLPLLRQFGAERLVIGHTPTRDSQVVTRFGGRLVKLDTGMNRAVYKGRAAALVIDGGRAAVRYAGDTTLSAPSEEALYVAPGDVADAQVLEALREGEITVSQARGMEGLEVFVDYAGRRLPAIFRAMDERGARREEAAFRLDRVMQLGIVPATVRRSVAARGGVLQARPRRWLTQKDLQQQGNRAGGWCAFEPQFQLIYALDTLAGNSERTASSILLDSDESKVLASSFGSAFGVDRGLPRYLKAKPPLPGAELRRRLSLLDEGVLSRALSGLVDAPARRAILQRRDVLLKQAAPAAN